VASITVRNPVAPRRVVGAAPLAPRPERLEGTTIGLYWNLKAGGDVALDRIESLLAERYPGVEFRRFSGSVGARPTMNATDAEAIRATCGALIGSVADTGGSTSWLAHDMAQVERLGVPTVAFVAVGMREDWQHSAEAFGMPDLRGAPLGHGLASTDSAAVSALAAEAFDAIVDGLLRPVEAQAAAARASEAGDPELLAFQGDDAFDALAAMEGLFVARGWSDGLPLVAPTERAVERMLAGTARDPSDVIEILEPAFGIATVEKIAINAVMAGAAPDTLPVLLAAVEAVADPHFMLRDATASTGIRALLLLVNGPIRGRIGLNCGTNALGPGAPSRVNTAIGRAMRLIYMNVGGAYSGGFDVGTIGSPAKYSLCAGENEEASPWPAYHVEQGFRAEASTVTAKTVFGLTETHVRRENTAEQLVDLAATAAAGTGAHIGWVTGGTGDPDKGVEAQPQSFWFIPPEHAAFLDAAGWDKARIRRYLYDHARVPAGKVLARYAVLRDANGTWLKNGHLQWLEDDPNLRIPVVASPDDFRLAVVGGPGPRGLWLWGHEEAVTRQIATD
jgi:hypothetical protein